MKIDFLLYIFWVLILTRPCIPTGICILIKLGYIFDQSLLVYFPHENIQSIWWIWNCWHNCNRLVTYPPFIIYFGFYSIFLVYSFFQVGVTCVLFSVRIRLSNRLFWSFCFYCIFCLTDRVSVDAKVLNFLFIFYCNCAYSIVFWEFMNFSVYVLKFWNTGVW